MSQRNDDVTGSFRRIDANRFTAVLYRQGEEMAGGTVWFGSDSGFGRGIFFSNRVQLDSNSYNENLTVGDDGYQLHLKGFGFSTSNDQVMGQQGAAEHLWGQFIEGLQ